MAYLISKNLIDIIWGRSFNPERYVVDGHVNLKVLCEMPIDDFLVDILRRKIRIEREKNILIFIPMNVGHLVFFYFLLTSIIRVSEELFTSLYYKYNLLLVIIQHHLINYFFKLFLYFV